MRDYTGIVEEFHRMCKSYPDTCAGCPCDSDKECTIYYGYDTGVDDVINFCKMVKALDGDILKEQTAIDFIDTLIYTFEKE